MICVHKPLTYREKQPVALRIDYRGGYTAYFRFDVERLLRMDFQLTK